MIKTYTIEKDQQPTPEQLAEIEAAKKYPITFDDDCPEMTPAMEVALRTAIKQKNRRLSQ